MRRPSVILPTIIASLLLPAALFAQNEDAIPLRSGTFRVVFAPDWSHWNQRFGRATPGFTNGALEPLAVDFNSDSLGINQVTSLFTVESRLRNVTGLSGYALNLGRARLTLNNSVRVLPIGFELAVSNRLILRTTVPLVRARVEAFLLGADSTGAGAAVPGNVGRADAVALEGFRTQAEAALIALQTQAASGPASLQAQAQATYNALRPFLCDLYTLAGGNAAAGSPCNFPSNHTASPVLPIASTEAGDSIAGRVAAARTSYANLRTQYQAQGVTLPVFDATFALPTLPLDSAGLRTALSAPGVAGDSLASIVRTRLGDIEVGAGYQLSSGARWRSRIDVTFRLPTGTEDSPHNFVDLGTGTGQLGYEIAWRNDAILRPDFWLHAGVRVGGWSAGDLVRRVAPANSFLAPIADTATVSRALGTFIQLDLVPNWQLDDAFRVGVGMHYFRQGATHFTYVDAGAAARTGFAASVLDQETENTNLRIGAGVSFSTLNRYAAGRASMPYSVSIGFTRTYWGSGGNVPAVSAVNAMLKMYLRLWG